MHSRYHKYGLCSLYAYCRDVAGAIIFVALLPQQALRAGPHHGCWLGRQHCARRMARSALGINFSESKTQWKFRSSWSQLGRQHVVDGLWRWWTAMSPTTTSASSEMFRLESVPVVVAMVTWPAVLVVSSVVAAVADSSARLGLSNHCNWYAVLVWFVIGLDYIRRPTRRVSLHGSLKLKTAQCAGSQWYCWTICMFLFDVFISFMLNF